MAETRVEALGGAPVRAVMFDFDGTLVDTMGDFAGLAGALIAEAYGGTADEGRAAYLRTSGVPFFQQLQLLFPDDPRNAALVAAFEREKLRFYEGLGLYPDVPPALAALAARGIATVVSSNNFQDVVDTFLAGQDVRFDLVLGFRDGFHKGAPHFAHAIEALGVAREGLVFVGDSVRDAELADAAGVRFVARTGTAPRTAFEARFGPEPFPFVDRLDEVLALVDGDAVGAAP